MDILASILENKRAEIALAEKSVPLKEMVAKATAASHAIERRPFKALFEKENTCVLIAEIKPKSPSAGTLIEESALDIADMYAKSEADVISVLTDKEYFGGTLDLLREVRARVPQTILRKDFIIEEYQVYETLHSGADAFLLIAAALDTEKLRELVALGRALGLDTLVEIHDEEDAKKALASGADIIGINNRDLKTLKVSLATTERLIPLIQKEIPIISESGIETPEDVRRVRHAGVRGILVGTSVLRSEDPQATIAEMKRALVI